MQYIIHWKKSSCLKVRQKMWEVGSHDFMTDLFQMSISLAGPANM